MQTYFKIFFVIAALVAAFLLGRNFGFETKTEELTMNKQQHAKDVQNKETVEKAKQFDVVKRRLQDIVDSVGTQNKDELLSQIFNVLFVDMGLSIKSETGKIVAKTASAEATIVENAEEKTETLAKTVEQKKILAEIQNQKSSDKTIKAEPNKAAATEPKADKDCSDVVGMYKGSIRDIKNKYFGSLTVYFKQDADKKIKGAVTLLSDQNKIALSKSFVENCGKTTPNGLFRIISLSNSRYLQIEKTSKSKNVVGGFYEVLPKGTEKEIGSFILNRIDQF